MKAQKIDDWRNVSNCSIQKFIFVDSFNSASSTGNKIEVNVGQYILAITGGDHTYYMINTEKQPIT